MVSALVERANRAPVRIVVTAVLLFAMVLYLVSGLNSRTPVSSFKEKSDALTLVVDTLTSAISGPVFAAAKLIAVPLVFILGALVVLRLIRHAQRPPELVIADLNNASGVAELDGLAKGFIQLIRQELARELRDVRGRVKIRLEQDRSDLLLKAPLPTAVQDQSLAELIKTLAETTPAPLKAVVQLAGLVFPPRGTKVVSSLQREGDTPGKPGITFEITDIEGEKLPELHTIWEEPPNDGSSQMVPTAAAAPKPNGLPQPDSRQQAQRYREIAELVGSAGLFKDAVGYLEEALKLRPVFTAAAQDLAQNTSRLQVQDGNASAYATGKKLQDAGLLNRAISCYKKPLPPDDLATAETAWKTSLRLAPGDEAAAYRELATLYRQDGVYLFDESTALYKLAVEKGSSQAVGELDSIQQRVADTLTRAGQLLLDLTKYEAAEKYLLVALKGVPDHPQAQAALAALKQRKPPEENKEARAFFALGTLYEKNGALEQAKTQYEEALKKQPTYQEAADALRRVLASKKRTLSERYIALLGPASRYLALEISKQTMLDDVSRDRIATETSRDRAQVYNFVGACYLNSATSHSVFYRLAISNFKRATECDREWYLPYENLGDTYSYVGQHYDSLLSYDKAFERTEHIRNKSARQYTRCRLRVSAAITKLALGGAFTQEARDEIRCIKREQVERERDYDPDREARFLYNLACWYAVAAQRKVEGKKATEMARRYLAYSLAKNLAYCAAKNRGEDLWSRVERDEDLDEGIRKGLDDLKFELRRQLKETTNLPELTNERFLNVMDDVLERAKWPTRPVAMVADGRASVVR